MKDLKHLIYFERLLENADNELIEKAKADGGFASNEIKGGSVFSLPEDSAVLNGVREALRKFEIL